MIYISWDTLVIKFTSAKSHEKLFVLAYTPALVASHICASQRVTQSAYCLESETKIGDGESEGKLVEHKSFSLYHFSHRKSMPFIQC